MEIGHGIEKLDGMERLGAMEICNLCDKKHIDILDGMEIGHGMEMGHCMEKLDGIEICNLCDKKYNVNTNNPNALY